MNPLNDKIIVKVDADQKRFVDVGGNNFLLAKQYTNNRREQNPVVCEVIIGNSKVKAGEFLLVHHNRFSEHSPYELDNGHYAIPYDRSLFARINDKGEPRSMCGNIIAQRVEKSSAIEVAASYKKNYNDRVIVLSNGYGYKKGDEIFTYPFSDYQIVYVWKGEEKRVVKVYIEDICGKLSKN